MEKAFIELRCPVSNTHWNIGSDSRLTIMLNGDQTLLFGERERSECRADWSSRVVALWVYRDQLYGGL